MFLKSLLLFIKNNFTHGKCPYDMTLLTDDLVEFISAHLDFTVHCMAYSHKLNT